MQRHRRIWVIIAGLGLFAVLLAGAFSAYGAQVHAAGGPTPRDGETDQDVVQHYFQIFNSALTYKDAQGNCSNAGFDVLADVYAPDATLTQTNSHNVIAVRHGVDNIIQYYKTSFGCGTPVNGAQFLPDLAPRPGDSNPYDVHPAIRSLAPHVVDSYEYAKPIGWAVAGYCEHLFTLQGGMIESLDWVTYYGPFKVAP